MACPVCGDLYSVGVVGSGQVGGHRCPIKNALELLLVGLAHEPRKFGGDYYAAAKAASAWVDEQLIERTDTLTREHRLREAIREHRRRRGSFAVWKGDRRLWAALGRDDA
jgi:hypothetical protein